MTNITHAARCPDEKEPSLLAQMTLDKNRQMVQVVRRLKNKRRKSILGSVPAAFDPSRTRAGLAQIRGSFSKLRTANTLKSICTH